MRKLLLVAGFVAVIGVPAAQAGNLRIAVTSVAISSKRTDVLPKGASKGDTIVVRDRLLNAKAQFGHAKGAVVGSDRGTMTFTGAHTATFSGVAVLPGGTLRLVGKLVPVTGGFTIPVNGGTGRFAKAKGYVLVGHGARTAPNTYTLTLPTIPVA